MGQMGREQFLCCHAKAEELINATPSTHIPMFVSCPMVEIVEMAQSKEITKLKWPKFMTSSKGLQTYVVAFGRGAETSKLQKLADKSPDSKTGRGKVFESNDVKTLVKQFEMIATDMQSAAPKLMQQVGKQIGDAVTHKL